MDALTHWVLREAIRQASKWRHSKCQLDLAVNISASNLNDLNLPDTIAELCEKEGVNSSHVTLEVTESITISELAKTMDILARFRVKDFALSIDDFGTGFSSLSQLQQLPFSELKVDKSFVSDMDCNRDSAVIAKAVIDLGHNLGLTVCAEGVENEEVLRMLHEFDCDYVQGFHISKPVEAVDIPDIQSLLPGRLKADAKT